MVGARPELAVIYAPAFGQVFGAVRGRGATLNGDTLNCAIPAGRRILIDNYPEPRGIAAEAFTGLKCTGYMESGSLALKVCRVADGSADIFIKDVVVRDWDMAAP